MEVSGIGKDVIQQKLGPFFRYSGEKIRDIERFYDPSLGSPVFTVKGQYTTHSWTDWTEGFVYGSMLLQYDVTGENDFLETAKKRILEKMALHISNFGVHDHGFNIVSTYGNLLRMMNEGIIPDNIWERETYTMAIRQSAAIQAMRWTEIPGGGYIYSFNGPHSLFIDTLRSCRVLMLAHRNGHYATGERDVRINLLERAIRHILTSARHSVYYGEGRDIYDQRGRVAHESVFNIRDGSYRCPNSQQGWSGFSTWTRGLAWAILGFAEEIEFLDTLMEEDFQGIGDKKEILEAMLNAARATCDFYIDHTPADGIPYWDTAAPGLSAMGRYLERKADPYNDFEPVDSSAAAIAAQGFLRLGRYLEGKGDSRGDLYSDAGMGIAAVLFDDPYLSRDKNHQGLLLHSVYHRPNGWDYIPEDRKIPCGESSMWGDYHARELALCIHRLLNNRDWYTFFN